LSEGVLIKAFYSDVPPDMIYQIAQTDVNSGFVEKVGKVHYTKPDGTSDVLDGINYFQIDSKWICKFKLRKFDLTDSYNTLESKIYNLFKVGEQG
jgi:hypothetical protein